MAKSPYKRFFPWYDRAGRFFPLKAACFLFVLFPGVGTAITWAVEGLGPRPVTIAIHTVGDWGVRFLLLSLAVTPFRRLFFWPKLIFVRRMLGVAAAAYIVIHFCLYVVDQKFDLGKVASEIVLRIYLTIGFVGLVGLLALAITSTDGMMKRLGKNWRRLHTLAYPIGVIAVIHFMLQSKSNVSEPVLMGGFFLWLMTWRALDRARVEVTPAVLLAMAIGLTAVTALGEASWYALASNFRFERVFLANFNPPAMGGLRPAGWMLLTGLFVTAFAASRAESFRLRGR